MMVPHNKSMYAQPMSVMPLPPAAFRLAASACVVMPIAAQTTAVIAIIRPIVMLSPVVGPASSGLTNKTGRIDVAQPKITLDPGVHALSVACPLWVISRHLRCKTTCPLYAQKRTCAVHQSMSAKCQQRTSDPLFSVVLVGNFLQPIDGFPIEPFLNGNMGHSGCWCCTVPVLLTR